MSLLEHERAKRWRESHGLSLAQLADLTGYTEISLRWFEKGQTPPMRNAKGGHAADRRIKPWVWKRFKNACAGVDNRLKTGKSFEW